MELVTWAVIKNSKDCWTSHQIPQKQICPDIQRKVQIIEAVLTVTTGFEGSPVNILLLAAISAAQKGCVYVWTTKSQVWYTMWPLHFRIVQPPPMVLSQIWMSGVWSPALNHLETVLPVIILHVFFSFLFLQMLITRGATSTPTATAALRTLTPASGVQASVCLWEATAPLIQ